MRVYTTISPTSSATLAASLANASESQSHTRWLSANIEPSTPLERAAAAVFALHTYGLQFDMAKSGAEYWVKSHVEESEDASGPLGGGIHLRAHPLATRPRLSPNMQPLAAPLTT